MTVRNMIEHILISAQSMEESLGFYRDIIGMSVIEDHPLESEKIERLWNLPKGIGGRAVFLKNEEQSTLLTLIEFKPHSGRFVRDNTHVYDYGLFDVAFRTKNVDSAYHYFKRRGFEFISPPVIYTADWIKVTVKEALMIGPNQMPIALIERLTEPKIEIKGDFGTMIDSAQFVENIDSVSKFYVDLLGLNKVFDSWLPKGLINEVVALPPGVDSRMAFLLKPGSNTPMVELIQCSIKANHLTARPTDLGIFATSWETEDLSALSDNIKKGGYPVSSHPVEMRFGPHGKIRMITVEGPDKVLFQFFEK